MRRERGKRGQKQMRVCLGRDQTQDNSSTLNVVSQGIELDTKIYGAKASATSPPHRDTPTRASNLSIMAHGAET